MPLDTEQRTALRLELLHRANERDRWINDHYRKLDADLERARRVVRDCNSYADIAEWERRRITPEAWAARKVVRRVLNSGSLVRHELDLRISWSGEPCRRIGDAEEATSKIEAQIAARPPFIRQWETERDLLRSLASDVEMARMGRATVAQAEEQLEQQASKRATSEP